MPAKVRIRDPREPSEVVALSVAVSAFGSQRLWIWLVAATYLRRGRKKGRGREQGRESDRERDRESMGRWGRVREGAGEGQPESREVFDVRFQLLPKRGFQRRHRRG